MENDDYLPKHDRFEASVNLFIDPSQKAQIIDALSKLENIEQIYEVKGEFDIVSIVSASNVAEFRNILRKKIMKIKGVKSSIVSVVLKAHRQYSYALPRTSKKSSP